MESFYFLKFWRLTTTQKHNHPTNQNLIPTVEETEFTEDQDDSFFELEITNSADWNSLEINPKSDSRSKRKILPIEPTSKTQSSIKSGPKFKVLMFTRSKSMSLRKTEQPEGYDTQKLKSHESKLLALKFNDNINGSSKNGALNTKDNSLRRLIAEHSVSDCNNSSRRFSKDVIQKYFKRINPLYVKRESESNKFSGELVLDSPSSSPATVAANSPQKGIRRMHTRKRKSATSMATAVASPTGISRRDDSLLLQHDGIQSAILHCKQSFNSGDCSLVSRIASEPMYDKSIALPRYSCEETRRVYNETRFCSIS